MGFFVAKWSGRGFQFDKGLTHFELIGGGVGDKNSFLTSFSAAGLPQKNHKLNHLVPPKGHMKKPS